jgi:hypothetical protein
VLRVERLGGAPLVRALRPVHGRLGLQHALVHVVGGDDNEWVDRGGGAGGVEAGALEGGGGEGEGADGALDAADFGVLRGWGVGSRGLGFEGVWV